MKTSKISNPLMAKEESKDYFNAIDQDLENLFLLVSSRVRFGDAADGNKGENISGEYQIVSDTGNANTEFSITHTLGVVPSGFIVTNISKGSVIYDSGTAWTSTTIYLKSGVANTNVTLFLLK